MQYTEHLALKKPGLNDYINIQDLNDNADLLDAEVDGKADRKLSNLDTPQTALYNLGAGVRPNLGDNCDFMCPINQRGKTSWTATYGDATIFDRWKLQGHEAEISAQLISTGLKISMTGTNQGLKQPYSSDYLTTGEIYTSTVIVDGMLYSAEIVPDIVTGKIVQYPGADFSCAVTFDDGKWHWYPVVDYRSGNRDVTISACKLENGKGQTLCYFSGDNIRIFCANQRKSEVLLDCQKYLWVPRRYGTDTTIGYAVAESETEVKMVLSLPTTMRDDIVPTVNVDLTKLFFRRENVSINTATSLSVGVGRGDRLIVFFVGTGFSAGEIYDVYIQGSGAYFEVSCEY